MSDKKESRPELGNTIKEITAYAYGYALTLWSISQQEHYKIQAQHLKEDLRVFQCFIEGTDDLKKEYFQYFSAGSDKAAEDDGAELE